MEAERSLAESTDADLVRLAIDDPAGAPFQLLYERHEGATFGFLLSFVGERSLAEDLLQETFFRVYQHLERYDPAQPFGPWLFRIARNASLNALRTRRRKGGSKLDVDAIDPAISDRVLAVVAGDEAREAVQRALAGMDADARALLIQRHGLDMKLTDLAASWQVTERTIRNRLHAAVKELARALVDQSSQRPQGGDV